MEPLGSGPATAADSWKLHQQFEAIKSSLAVVTVVTVMSSKRPRQMPWSWGCHFGSENI
jgi:hypothetical protein